MTQPTRRASTYQSRLAKRDGWYEGMPLKPGERIDWNWLQRTLRAGDKGGRYDRSRLITVSDYQQQQRR